MVRRDNATGGQTDNTNANGGTGAQRQGSSNTSPNGGTSSSTNGDSGGTKASGGHATGGGAANGKGGAANGKGGTTSGPGATGGTREASSIKATYGGTSTSAKSTVMGGTAGGSSKTSAKAEAGAAGNTIISDAPCSDDLMTLAVGPKNDWITGTTGVSCGVQGALYGYGDDASCDIPADGVCTREEKGGPVKCCISGETVIDDTYKAWGCAMGLDLNTAEGGGNKLGYAGPARGFTIGITVDTIAAGQEVRIAYEQIEADAISPFVGGKSQGSTIKLTGGKGNFQVLFTDVSCPPSDWGTCTAPGKAPLALQIQLPGGGNDKTKVGAFKNFCITSIKPIT